MADRKIDEAKANAWLKEVTEELNSVKRVLEEVPTVTTDMPGDNDTFIQCLEATNNFLTSAWDTACKGFDAAWNKVTDVLKEVNRAGKVVAEELENLDNYARR